ncbi:MAG: hypothetical protein HC821_01725 [Lewinella sp.]|nr:hypothetical protein [Lewinella sp.]
MFPKFNTSPPLWPLGWVTLGLVLLGLIVGNGLLVLCFGVVHSDGQWVVNPAPSATRLRLGVLVNQICTFVLPALGALWLRFGRRWAAAVELDRLPRLELLPAVFLLP